MPPLRTAPGRSRAGAATRTRRQPHVVDHPTQQGRAPFFSACCFFASRRFLFTARGTFVFLRGLGFCRAYSSRRKKRAMTFSLFLCWLRLWESLMIKMSSLVILFESFSRKRPFCSSSKACELATSHDRMTLVEVLLTF